jgi:hypothetical protein
MKEEPYIDEILQSLLLGMAQEAFYILNTWRARAMVEYFDAKAEYQEIDVLQYRLKPRYVAARDEYRACNRAMRRFGRSFAGIPFRVFSDELITKCIDDSIDEIPL